MFFCCCNGGRVNSQEEFVVGWIEGIRSMAEVDFATSACMNKLSFHIYEILYTVHVSTAKI